MSEKLRQFVAYRSESMGKMPKDIAAAALAWRIEETCLNAWPALREIVLDGWLVRLSDGLSRRNNSANPLSARSTIGDATIAETVAFYRRHERPAIFRVPSIAAPAADKALDKAGFAAEAETCVLHGDMAGLDATEDPSVTLLARADRQWFQAMSALQGHKPEEAHTYRRVIGAISVPAAFVAIPGEDGKLVALAYGVIHNGLLCYESVVTDSRQRRRGHARKIVTTLAGWAKAQGATGACLQVVAENAPARALYEQIGLGSEVYRYHYRRAAAD
jgi:GNAT superfamily N-acetyltransferase